MALRSRRAQLGAIAALVVACVALGLGGRRWWQAEKINRAIADGSIAGFAQPLPPQALFAQADLAVRARHIDRALDLYKQLDRYGGELRVAALYNSANIHLRQALEFRRADNEPALITPAELAKSAYRAALRIDPQHWNARFNLERALRLRPDAPEGDPPPAPSQAERAATTMRGSTLGLP